MNFFEWHSFLNLNPVLLLGTHFQYWKKILLWVVVLVGPLDKVKYHAVRMEFQWTASPNTHFVFMNTECPHFWVETLLMDVHFFVESIITALLPDRNTYLELFELLTTHQATSHSKSCRKYKNLIWRYNLGINFSFIISFFISRTFLAVLSPSDGPKNRKM